MSDLLGTVARAIFVRECLSINAAPWPSAERQATRKRECRDAAQFALLALAEEVEAGRAVDALDSAAIAILTQQEAGDAEWAASIWEREGHVFDDIRDPIRKQATAAILAFLRSVAGDAG